MHMNEFLLVFYFIFTMPSFKLQVASCKLAKRCYSSCRWVKWNKQLYLCL